MSPHPYEALSPDLILDAVESRGYLSDGRLLSLNSYENRVIQVGIEEATPLVAKFYRPDRWSDEAIREEHAFSQALAAEEIPVVAPLADDAGETLFEHQGFRFALYPRQGGRWPDLDDGDKLEWIGRFLGRIHLQGAARPFAHRPTLNPQTFGHEPVAFVLGCGLLPEELKDEYARISGELLAKIEQRFAAVNPRLIRLHGDCHPGNILWTDDGPHFVDMDDCRMGPAIQDLWMLLSGDRSDLLFQLDCLREGYETFRPLDTRELALIEPLRSLRLIHYAAWLARRWQDPAFPRAFPWFGTPAYWQEHLLELGQQSLHLDDPPLDLGN